MAANSVFLARVVIRVVPAVVLALLLAACPMPGVDMSDGIQIYNETGESVTIYWVDGENETEVTEISADHIGGYSLDMPECVDMALVARADDGAEIARHGPPVCHGSNFVIGPEE